MCPIDNLYCKPVCYEVALVGPRLRKLPDGSVIEEPDDEDSVVPPPAKIVASSDNPLSGTKWAGLFSRPDDHEQTVTISGVTVTRTGRLYPLVDLLLPRLAGAPYNREDDYRDREYRFRVSMAEPGPPEFVRQHEYVGTTFTWPEGQFVSIGIESTHRTGLETLRLGMVHTAAGEIGYALDLIVSKFRKTPTYLERKAANDEYHRVQRELYLKQEEERKRVREAEQKAAADLAAKRSAAAQKAAKTRRRNQAEKDRLQPPGV